MHQLTTFTEEKRFMLRKIDMLITPSVERLIQAWSQLYAPDCSVFSLIDGDDFQQWVEAALPTGRAATVAKLNSRLIEMKCQIASIQTKELYNYMPTVLNFNELRQLADTSLHLYQQLFDLYQQHAPSTASSLNKSLALASRSERADSGWGIPDLKQLAQALEPILLQFQEYHQQARDWRSLGFLTTQLNFCNDWIAESLTPPELLLLSPYFKFVEEQVAHPWQRVCAAGAKYSLNSPVLQLVERMIPTAEGIAQVVYEQLLDQLPYHQSRRGSLRHPGVTHSCLRDLKMFQSYLWLCVLEESIAPVEEELLRLCIMVLPSVEVKWELIELWIQMLVDEIISRIESSQQHYVLPYTVGMYHSFVVAKAHLSPS
jgi:hypothetical protein